MSTTITILGAGYVGLTSAALFSHAGYKVYVVEPNLERLEAIKQGRSFFYEAGIDAIIQAGLEKGTLIPTASYKQSVSESAVVFSCVGTPDNPDGSSNLSYVFSAATEAINHLKTGSIFVQKSTVPVGTGQQIEQIFKETAASIDYVSNPEFLREGTAVYDTLYFDRVVVGGNNVAAANAVLDIYRELEVHRDKIAAIGNVPKSKRKGLYIATGLSSAELIKVTSNAFLALKISFANSIAKLSDVVDADISDVMKAVGADERIGTAFLNAGRGYGGGCFPKDVSGLISSSIGYGVELDIMKAVQKMNVSMPAYIVTKLTAAFDDQDLSGKHITVLGMAFKSGTSDVRKSPGIAIANLLTTFKVKVSAYDPQANEEARHELHDTVELASSLSGAVSGADAVIIATDWPEFVDYPASALKRDMRGLIVLDALNCMDRQTIKNAGLRYVGVGR